MVAFTSGELNRQKLLALLQAGSVALFLDNFPFNDDRAVRLFGKFLRELPPRQEDKR
jgi:hypothetical protein